MRRVPGSRSEGLWWGRERGGWVIARGGCACGRRSGQEGVGTGSREGGDCGSDGRGGSMKVEERIRLELVWVMAIAPHTFHGRGEAHG